MAAGLLAVGDVGMGNRWWCRMWGLAVKAQGKRGVQREGKGKGGESWLGSRFLGMERKEKEEKKKVTRRLVWPWENGKAVVATWVADDKKWRRNGVCREHERGEVDAGEVQSSAALR